MDSYTQLEKLVEECGFSEVIIVLQSLKDRKMKEIFINIRTYKEGIKDGSITKEQWDEVITLYRKEVENINYEVPYYSRGFPTEEDTKINFEETIQRIDDIEHTSHIIGNYCLVEPFFD